MNKYKIAYIDESQDEIRKFQRRVYDVFDVITFFPKTNLEEFVDELLGSDADAFVSDFRLNEYRIDINEPINYSGAELVERLLNIRQGFPCFVLTSFDNDAIQETSDVNYVYSKDVLTEEKQTSKFAERIRVQVEHYKNNVDALQSRFLDLVEKSENEDLTEEEENELLSIDTLLEKSINLKNALPDEKKRQLAIGKIDELIASTSDLLKLIKQRKAE